MTTSIAVEAPLTRAEQVSMRLRLSCALAAGGLLVAGLVHQAVAAPDQRAISACLQASAALLVAAPVMVGALGAVARNDPRGVMDQLVGLAVVATLATGDFVTAALIPMILDISHFLEQRSVLGAQAAIDALRRLESREARLITPAGERAVDPGSLEPGQRVALLPGERVPADGTVVHGSSAVDASTLTGESVPEDVAPGSRVLAGSTNLTGRLEVEVTRAAGESTIARVLELLAEAERARPPIIQALERYAGAYVPVLLVLALTVLFMSKDPSRAISVLVVGCPGAFVLAGPAAMVAALAAGSRIGLLIKSARFLESLAAVDAVVLDKTGTATTGELSIAGLAPRPGVAESALLEGALVCGRASTHPVAVALARAAEARGLASPVAERTSETPGRGVIAEVDGETYRLGRREWIVEAAVEMGPEPTHAGPVVWVARGSTCLGAILLADQVRPEAADAVAALRRIGVVEVLLVTGDRSEAAQAVAGVLGVERAVAGVLPEGKVEVVRAVQATGRVVMVVGDGVNDAPALAAADVGVAMGARGSGVALHSADVALVAPDLRRLADAVELARRTRRTVDMNVLIGAGSSIAMLALAAAGVLSPLTGAVLHNVGEIYVLVNSARLLETDRS